MSYGPKLNSDIPAGHPSRETRVFHRDDLRLRRHGFRIMKRHRNDEAVWSRCGEEYLQSSALAICQREGYEKAAKKEQQVA